MTTKQQEERNKRFDEKFVVKSNAGTDLLRYTDANLIKSFLQSEIDLAVAEERDKLLGLVVRNCHGFTERDGEKLWQLDMYSLERDLITNNPTK